MYQLIIKKLVAIHKNSNFALGGGEEQIITMTCEH